MNSTPLTILSTEIRRDAQGRYSLGDCWQLSGKEAKNTPARWHGAEKTQEFLATLRGEPENGITPISVVKYGPNEGRGFWGNKEAVIHYAMWINPEFCLTVIRAFDAMVSVSAPSTPAVPKTFREALLLAADQQEQIERQQAQIEQDAPKVAALAMISEKDGDLGIRDTGRELGVGQNVVRELILARGWACIQGKDPRPAYYGLKHGYTRLVARPYTDRVTGQEKVTDDFKITRKGITRLAEIIAAEKRG